MTGESQKNSVDQLLTGFRSGYLEELPDKCDKLEAWVLMLGQLESFIPSFGELYRLLHSMKGSAGTLGLAQVSNICHQFEDALHLCEGDAHKVTPELTDSFLDYIDLVRSATTQYRSGTVDAASIAKNLQHMRESLFPASYHGIYIDTSKLGVRICQEALATLPIKLTVAIDGLAALERLLQEKFDFIITSSELPRLNGVALMAAVRLSSSYNSAIKSVMITSKEKLDNVPSGLFDLVLKKDSTISPRLKQELGKLLGIK